MFVKLTTNEKNVDKRPVARRGSLAKSDSEIWPRANLIIKNTLE